MVSEPVVARVPVRPPPKKPPSENTGGAGSGGSGGSSGGSGGGKGGGRSYTGALLGLGGLVAITPVAALAIKSKVDPDGFKRDVDASLPAFLASRVTAAFIAAPKPAPPPPAPVAAKPAEPEPPKIPDAVLADARKAAEEQERLVQEAALKAQAQAAAAAEAERKRKAEVEAQLEEELLRLAQDKEELEKAIAAMRSELSGPEGAGKLPPQIIFQEHQLSDQLRDRLDQLYAESVADKVVAELSKDKTLPHNPLQLDPAAEPALRAGAGLEEVQGRVSELLSELDSRTRLEGMKIRELIRQTEEASRHDLMQSLVSQLAAQEKELQRIMDIQVAEVNRVCAAEVKRRDASYQQTMLKEWDEVNKRSEEYAALSIRVLELQQFMKRQALMKADREELSRVFSEKANKRIQSVEDLRLRSKAVDKMLDEGKQLQAAHATLVDLFFLLDEAAQALDQGAKLQAHIDRVRSAAGSQAPLLKAALDTFPDTTAPVPSKEQLNSSLQTTLLKARKAMLVPPEGGMVWEAYSAVRGLFMRPFADAKLPQGLSDEARLRRANYYIQRGEEEAAVKELSALETQAAQAVQSWLEMAKKRLLVRQALQLVRVHVMTSAPDLI